LDVLCGKCPIGTQKLESGGILADCLLCDAGKNLFDLDNDASTECAAPLFKVVDYQHYIPIGSDQTRYDFLYQDNPLRNNDRNRPHPNATIDLTDLYFDKRATMNDVESYQTLYEGVSVLLPPINLTAEHVAAGNIAYTIEDAPPGFFVNPTTGELLGVPRLRSSTATGEGNNQYTTTVFAVDGAGAKAPIETVHFTVVSNYKDIAIHGPHKQTCNHDTFDDGDSKFDSRYTCDCTGTIYTGDNCERLKTCPYDHESLVGGECIPFKFEFEASDHDATYIASTHLRSTDYTNIGADQTYFAGSAYTYKIPPVIPQTVTTEASTLVVDGTINAAVSQGSIADIQFVFGKGAPPGFFVKPNTGEMFGSFDEEELVGEQFKRFNFTLLAVDAGGAKVVVRHIVMDVIPAGIFRVLDWDWNADGIGTIAANTYVHQNKANVSTNPTKIYGVGGTYQFPPIHITETENSKGVVTFTMEGAPNGFLIDPSTGYIKGTPTNATGDNPTMKIYAVNGAGERTETPLQTIMFDVRVGPNGTHCENGGEIISDKSGISFTCDCNQTITTAAKKGFNGPNCKNDIEKEESKKKANDEEAARKTAEADANVQASKAEAEKKQTSFTTGVAAGGVILLLLIVAAAVKYQQHRIAMKPVDFDTQFALMVSMGLIEPEHVKVKMKPREIRRKDLTLVKVIGSGAFGEVYKAQLDEMFTRSTPEYTVAAKTVLDAKSSPEATREMLAEAGVMAAVGSHPNLVSLIGVITRGDPLVLILQFCAQGELLGMLKKAAAEGEPIALLDKMQMAREVAQGMAHLSKEHFIHRDLACRNVLYSEGMCKIADFGLSRGSRVGEAITPDEWTHENADRVDRGETHEDYYKSTTGVFPVRWTAPEAMETLRFTPASDVWSFGIVVIELLVDGDTPYHGMSNPDVMKLTMSGGRHPKPALCSNKLYDMLLKCWDADAAKRPAFPQLCDAFKEMYTVSAKSSDANAARVEAATNDKLKRGEAANQYSSFEDAPVEAGGMSSAPSVGRADGQVVHNPLFDVDAFVARVANAPTSESLHTVPAPPHVQSRGFHNAVSPPETN
jgi:serine/threonine protein kinase